MKNIQVPKKNIQNMNDNKCFEVRYLHPGDHHQARVKKIDEILAAELDFEGIKFTAKIKDITKSKKRILSVLVTLVLKIRENNQSIYQKSVPKTNILIYY